MERFLLPDPLPVSGNLPEQWLRFKKQFTQFIDASDKADANAKTKTAILLRCIGDKGNDIYDNFTFEGVPTFDDVIAKFDEFCRPRVSVFASRHHFLTMKQNDRSIDDFITALKKQVRECAFGDLRDDMVLHALTLGLDQERTRRRLFETKNLDLEKAITLCRLAEDTEGEMRKLKLNEEVQAVYKTRQKKAKRRPRSQPTHTSSNKADKCGKCGTEHPPRQCPAFGSECYACKKKNHYAKCCRAPQAQSKAKRVYLVDGDSDSSILRIQVDKEGRRLMATINVSSESRSAPTALRCQLDTAATCNVLSVTDYRLLGSPPLRASTSNLTMYDGSQVPSKGRCSLTLREIDQREEILIFEVVKTRHATLLSLDTCLKLDLIAVSEHVSLVEDRTNDIDAAITEYADVFTGLGCLPSEYNIEIDTTVAPVQNRPRKVAYALKDEFLKKIEALEAQGVIAKVETPTQWISSCLAVRKANGSVRVCIDPSDLNKAIRRNHFSLPTIEEVLPTLTNAKIFSLVDAKDGFLQVKLTDESSYLTTFWTPAGKYRWLRMPFGISSSPEEFQRRLQQALEGLEGISTVADDILIVGRGQTEAEARRDHDSNFIKLLQRAREQNLNRSKMRLHMKEIVYIGHVLSPDGVKPDPDKVCDIKNMPTPMDVEQVRRFLGFTNYIAKFMPNLSAVCEPIRRLVQKDAEFVWGPDQQEAFERVKDIATAERSLSYYDVTKPVVLQCDASTQGLGVTLLQNEKPVAYASRSLTASERNYTPIELECLAIVFACRKYDQYIYGHPDVTIHSDHKPLETIFRKSLLEAPKRLQRMMMALQRYDMKVVYKPGSEQLVADMLSRAPSTRRQPVELTKEQIFQVTTENAIAEEVETVDPREYVNISEPRVDAIRQATADDPVLQKLLVLVASGWPQDRSQLPSDLKVYWTFRDVIAGHNGILYKGERMFIPKSLQNDMLVRLHSSHQGIESTLRRARDSLYWHGMTNDVKQTVERCSECSRERPTQQKESLRSHTILPRAWAKVGMDLFAHGQDTYLIIVDYYSDFFEIAKLDDQRAVTTIEACKEQFARHGSPNIVHSDGGPQFISAEFERFAQSWEFEHSLSSPYHSQSNGKAEAAVKIAKQLLAKSSDPMKALLEWRNIPTSQMVSSPAQRLMNRRTRAVVPQAESLLKPAIPEVEQTISRKTTKQMQSQRYYNRSVSDLRPLQKGTPVFVQSLKKHQPIKWSRGTVVDDCNDRSYIVESEGRLLRRNRRYLRDDATAPHEFVQQREQQPLERQPLIQQRELQPRVQQPREQPRERKQKTLPEDEPRDVPSIAPEVTTPTPSVPASPAKVVSPVKTRSGRVVTKPARFQ